MIKYLGSKRTLIPDLIRVVSHFPELTSATDLFSGTCRVGHAFKRAGLAVHSNDLNAYAYALAMCYVAADREAVERDARVLIDEFNRMPGEPGYFTKAFCEDSRFFQPKNGARVDAIREAIERKDLDPSLKYVLLVSLMEAADRVDSTCGVQMAYVKKWAQRAFNDLELRMPDVVPAAKSGPCRATHLDAVEAAKQISTDIVYLDPPYNQHSYLSNYHIWETLVLWDKPEYYGVACKRMDCRTRKSEFNSRHGHMPAFDEILRHAARAPLVIVSFSDEGYQSRSHLEAVLREHGDVHVISKNFKRYVGAQIGIHNPDGKLVGEVSHVRNEEYIYLLATAGAEKSEITRQRLATFAESQQQASGQLFAVGADTARPRQHTAPEVSILTALREHGDLSARDLERITSLTSYRISSFLRRLMESGDVAVRAGTRSYYCVNGEAIGDSTEQAQTPPSAASAPSAAFPSQRRTRQSDIEVMEVVKAALHVHRGRAMSELLTRTNLEVASVRDALRELAALDAVKITGKKRGTLYWATKPSVANAPETPSDLPVIGSEPDAVMPSITHVSLAPRPANEIPLATMPTVERAVAAAPSPKRAKDQLALFDI